MAGLMSINMFRKTDLLLGFVFEYFKSRTDY